MALDKVGSHRGDISITGQLDDLVGAELAQVWFVRDHLQLIFEGDRESLSFQCYVWPQVQTGSTQVGFGGPAYRDSLCAAIGQQVSGVTSSRGITIRLVDRSFVLMPNADDLVGPEVAMLHSGRNGSGWTVWRPGEDSQLDQRRVWEFLIDDLPELIPVLETPSVPTCWPQAGDFSSAGSQCR